jgi:hypothetical protein
LNSYIDTDFIEGDSTLATWRPDCDLEPFVPGKQLIVSSFTYQGVRAKTKPAPKMYVKSADMASRFERLKQAASRS